MEAIPLMGIPEKNGMMVRDGILKIRNIDKMKL
jgi:hypothetical protein